MSQFNNYAMDKNPADDELQPRKRIRNYDGRYKPGAVYQLNINAKDLWLNTHVGRIETKAEIIRHPFATDKKILVRLQSINGQPHVKAYIKKSILTPAKFIGMNIKAVAPAIRVTDITGYTYIMPLPEGLSAKMNTEEEANTIIDEWVKNHLKNVEKWEFDQKYVFFDETLTRKD